MTPPTQVLIVTATTQRRGAEIQATELARALRQQSVDVEVVALAGEQSGPRLDVDVLGPARLSPVTLLRLRRRARHASVVVAYGSTTLPACAMALAGSGTPFVYRGISDPSYWVRGRVHRAVTGWQYRRATHVVSLWEGAAGSVSSLFGVPRARTSVIPNAREGPLLPVDCAEQQRARMALELPAGAPVVAVIGKIEPEKRVDRAVAVVSQLPDHHLLIVGDGSQRAAIESLALQELPGRCRLIGHVDDVRPALAAADVVLITSDVEGMPGVAIEAALAGRPVVSTPVGGVADLPFVHVAEHDPDKLADLVRPPHLAPNPDEIAAFTWPRVVGQWQELIARVAVPRRRGRLRRLARRGVGVLRTGLRTRLGRRGVITRVRTADPLISLTFDDGPDPMGSLAVADVLDRHGARGTFFVLGERVESHRAVIDELQRRGHEVASHSWDHRSLVRERPASSGWMAEQIARSALAVGGSRWLRPPYGHVDDQLLIVARHQGVEIVLWSVDGRDYQEEPAAIVADRVIRSLHPGDIVLLHDRLQTSHTAGAQDRRPTLDAIERILSDTQGRLRSVTITELVSAGRVWRQAHRVIPDVWSPPPVTSP